MDELFCLVLVLLKYAHVYQLVFFGGFELHAVLVAEFALHFLEAWVHQYLLQTPNNLVELVIVIVFMPTVDDLKLIVVVAQLQVLRAYTL